MNNTNETTKNAKINRKFDEAVSDLIEAEELYFKAYGKLNRAYRKLQTNGNIKTAHQIKKILDMYEKTNQELHHFMYWL